MNRIIFKYTVYLIFLIALQILVLNNINFLGHINPYVYVVFILILPFSMPKYGVLLLSFLVGISIDMWVYTPGINAAAMVFLGFMRNITLPLLEPRDGYEPGTHPSVSRYGWGWFMRYAALLVVPHHLVLFLLDAFSLENFGNVLSNAIYSSIFTLIIVVLTQSGQSKKRSISE